MLGGTISLLGTSTNLLASDVSRQLGFGPLELFSFTAIGVPVWLLGGLYMLWASDRLLPDRGGAPRLHRTDGIPARLPPGW